MERVPGRIGVAGDWHGNTAWATRAVRKIEVTGLDCDGAARRLGHPGRHQHALATLRGEADQQGPARPGAP